MLGTLDRYLPSGLVLLIGDGLLCRAGDTVSERGGLGPSSLSQKPFRGLVIPLGIDLWYL